MPSRLALLRQRALLLLCCTLAAVGTLLGVSRGLGPALEPPALALDIYPQLETELAQFPEVAGRAPGVEHVAFFGDSMLVETERGRGLPRLLEHSVNGALQRRSVQVHGLVLPGSGAFDYYFILDEVLKAQPQVVVISFNMTSLSDTWRNAFPRPELAGLLAPRRVPAALGLPIAWTGLTADRVLGYVALVQLGLVDPWTSLARVQVRVSDLRRPLIEWIATEFSAPAERRFRWLRVMRRSARFKGKKTGRFHAHQERERFGRALEGVEPDQPILRALGAAVSDLAQRDVPVLVYVAPANVDNLERVGLLEGGGFRRTVESVESVVRGAGGAFADFHALLPDAAFRDRSGHYSTVGKPNGTQMLATAIARELAEGPLSLSLE